MSAVLDFSVSMEFWVPAAPADDANAPAASAELLAVKIRELSVAEIRAMLVGEAVVSSEPPTALDVALWGMDPLGAIDLSPADIYRFTDLTPGASERMTMSQRRALVDRVREVNAGFFDLVEKWPAVVAELVKRMTPEPSPEPLSTPSSDPSPA